MGRPTPDAVLKLKANCKACPFYNRENFKPVLPVIPQTPYGVIINDAPSREESERGEMFTGPTGDALNEEFTHAKLLRSKLVLINAIACTPTARNVSVMVKALHACRGMFLNYREKVEANLPVLALGAWATAAYTGKKPAVEKTRGFIRHVTLSTGAKIDPNIEEGNSDEAI